MPRPLRVFLCHASQDKPAVRKLYRYLKQRGVQPWLDEFDLLPGEKWEEEIPNALFSSDVILVCLSKNSINKEGFVQREISFALDKAKEKREGTIFIVPAKLEECDVPPRLSGYQWVDLSRVDGHKRLMLSLNKRAASLGPEVAQAIVTDESQPKSPVSQSVSPPKIEKPVEKITLHVERVEEPKKEKPLPISREDSKAQELILKPAPMVEKKAEKQKKPDFLWLGIGGIVLLALMLGAAYGINYLVHIPATPMPSPTAQATSTYELPTATLEPPTETLASTLVPLTPTLGIGSTMISDKDGMVMLYVSAGPFTMGSDNGGANEKPAHTVYLDAYWIDQTDVTNAMYAKCVSAGACSQPASLRSSTRLSYYGNSQFDNYPVIYVNWNMADTYCKWAGRQLPTEAQWEKAARGTDGRIYPWGNNAPDSTLLNYNSSDTTAVGSYPKGASPYGVLDMAGNVWQWVADWYAAYPGNTVSDPSYGTTYRVLRGGSWNDDDNLVRSAFRSRSDPADTLSYDFGFRCSRSLP
jgi:formylglycine-generating enzyme required for sulfatase activity